MLPSAKITIYDNQSSDDSVKLAKNLGCKVISWSSKGILNELKQTELKNTCWKTVKDGWVLVLDMDEWLCITEADLNREARLGTTSLSIVGYDMIGKSKAQDLSDTDLHTIAKATTHKPENKQLCFLRPQIKEINYTPGAHLSFPEGDVKYSKTKYVNKHMSSLGLPFLENKMRLRYNRTHKMRKLRMATHYTTDIKKVKKMYNEQQRQSRRMRCDKKGYCKDSFHLPNENRVWPRILK